MWKNVEISEFIFFGDSLSTKFQDSDEFSNEYIELTPIPFILLPTVSDIALESGSFTGTKFSSLHKKKLTKQTKVEYQ